MPMMQHETFGRVIQPIGPTFSLIPDLMEGIREFNNYRRLSDDEIRNYRTRLSKLLAGDTGQLPWLRRNLTKETRDRLLWQAEAAAIRNAERRAQLELPLEEPAAVAAVPAEAPVMDEFEREQETRSLEAMESIFDYQDPFFMSGDVALHHKFYCFEYGSVFCYADYLFCHNVFCVKHRSPLFSESILISQRWPSSFGLVPPLVRLLLESSEGRALYWPRTGDYS